jgi:nitrogen fixation protein NifU and related proteins
MSDLRDLYQEVILDHYKHPRNFGPVDCATHAAEGDNPLCGDHVEFSLKIEGGRVIDAGFEGSGCAISTAAASLVTEAISGRSLGEVEEIIDGFHGLVTGAPGSEPGSSKLGKLAVLEGVREYPVRIKCATLAVHTLRAALEGKGSSVSTE